MFCNLLAGTGANPERATKKTFQTCRAHESPGAILNPAARVRGGAELVDNLNYVNKMRDDAVSHRPGPS